MSTHRRARFSAVFPSQNQQPDRSLQYHTPCRKRGRRCVSIRPGFQHEASFIAPLGDGRSRSPCVRCGGMRGRFWQKCRSSGRSGLPPCWTAHLVVSGYAADRRRSDGPVGAIRRTMSGQTAMRSGAELVRAGWSAIVKLPTSRVRSLTSAFSRLLVALACSTMAAFCWVTSSR